MRRILFVDDEPEILAGIRNLLRSRRHEWEMSFAVGGEEALNALQKGPIDVIVTDMRMPGIDGAMLLKEVKKAHPEIVRIVLSGYAELEASMRAVPVAHQFLSKPCEPQLLREVVERACNLQQLIDDEAVRSLVGKLDKLPTVPRVYSALTKALADESVAVADVAKILAQDMAICAKLLQLVNSSFFRLARQITSVEHAVTYLGFNTVKDLALSVEVFGAMEMTQFGGISIESLQQHALHTASIAARIAVDKQQAENAFMAGMLHDVGILVLATELPQHLQEALTIAEERRCPLYEVETELYGVTHAEVGAYLLGIWGLPYPVIEAVANHHSPQRVVQRGLDPLAAVHIANALAAETTQVANEELDTEYLTALGVEDQLDAWREIAIQSAPTKDGM